jgi:hypothetical protein
MNRFLFLFIILCLSSAAYANAIMVIKPVVPGAIILGKTATILIDYTVMNNTTQPLWNFSIYPAFNTDPKASCAISLKTNNCTSTLAPGDSCTFQIQLQGNVNLPASFMLSPRVCAFTIGTSAAVCSQPILSDRSIVNVANVPPTPTPNVTGCSANGGTGCYVMVSKNQMQGNMAVLSPAAPGAPDVSACNALSAVSKADCICGIEGPAANNGNGTWKAWLGLQTGGNNNPRQRLDNLLGHPAYPAISSWVSLETGLTVYPNWGSLGVLIAAYPDVSNVIATTSEFVHTGGFNVPSSNFAYTCTDWTTNVAGLPPKGVADAGKPNGTNPKNANPDSWNENNAIPTCDGFRPVYCTEVSP